nr:hypothetical protein [Bacilli bacterium]
MKVDIVDDNIIVFLNKYITKDLDYNDSKVLEVELKNIFDKLNLYHGIKIKGYYDVHIYIDDNFGIIIELIKDDIDYIDYDDIIDMKISINNVKLLYKIEDIFMFNKLGSIYLYKNNLYLEPNIYDIYLFENSEIVYKNIDDIRKYGRILKI